jgi:ADP-ribose pyrophosphatase YjhB (NUDIX family)
VILEQDGKVLLLRYNRSGHDVYTLPGGNIDAGELMKDALKRELWEEIQVDIQVNELLIIAEGKIDPKRQECILHSVFGGKIVKGSPTINPEETTALEICWLSAEELQTVNLYPNTAEAILKCLNKEAVHYPIFLSPIEQPWF